MTYTAAVTDTVTDSDSDAVTDTDTVTDTASDTDYRDRLQTQISDSELGWRTQSRTQTTDVRFRFR